MSEPTIDELRKMYDAARRATAYMRVNPGVDWDVPSSLVDENRAAAALIEAQRVRIEALEAEREIPKTYADMNTYPDPGDRVNTFKLETTFGYLIHERHMQARHCPSAGVAKQYVPGHGGDVWFVEHADESIAAYSVSEMCPLQDARHKDEDA